MIKRLKFGILAIIFSLFITSPAFAQTPTPTPGSRPTTSYELFWPIVAGRLPGDSLYPLKTIKEKIQLMMSFSTSKKASQNLTLSKKRLVESEKLYLESNNYDLANKTLGLVYDHLKQSVVIAKTLPAGQVSSEIKASIVREGENEVFFIKIIIEKLPQEQRSYPQSLIPQMEQIITELKSS